MKKFIFCIILSLLLFVGCSDEPKIELFSYDLTLRLPKASFIGEDHIPSDTSSPYYDEYHITAESESNVITINVEGDYFEPFEVALNPDIKNVDVSATAVLKEGEDRKIIQSASTYVIGLYYAAQNGEKDIPLDSYLYSMPSSETEERLEEYYNNICTSFSSFDPKGNLIDYGIYDLMFTDYLGNVTKNSDGAYTANITLSYSYIYKHEEAGDKEVFDDITIGVDMTYENGKWVVVDMENPLIV